MAWDSDKTLPGATVTGTEWNTMAAVINATNDLEATGGTIGGNVTVSGNLSASGILPINSDGAALGSTTKQFSDLFLAEGGVINWDNGDATLTQVGDVVTLAGADLKVASPGNVSTSVVTTDATQTLSGKTLTSPKFADLGFIADENGNELIVLDTVTSAVNELRIANAAASGNPLISAQGGDTDVSIGFQAKGAGTYRFFGTASGPAALDLYEDTDNGTNRVRLIAPSSVSDITLTLPTTTGTIYATGNTDVSVADGGTGRSTGTTAYALVATGTTATGAQQTLANGATTEILVGGGASALPVWTTAQGSGAPVRATSPTLVTPLLGTPTSGTLTNCTGLPVAGITASTSTALGVGSVELGHATDTTLSRSAAGVLAVEGVVIPSISSTVTLTNKRINPRLVTAASYTTDTGSSLDVSTCDQFEVTAQAGALLFNAPSGTPLGGQKLMIRIKDNGTARALTWNGIFRAIGTALPSTTVLSKTLYLGFIYNYTDTKWDLVASAQEA